MSTTQKNPSTSKPITIIESPYAGDVHTHKTYLRHAMRHSLLLGEAPYASHALYTQPGVLRDAVPEEREIGMTAGFEFHRVADQVAAYTDFGVSTGMERGMLKALKHGLEVIIRSIFDEPTEQPDYVITNSNVLIYDAGAGLWFFPERCHLGKRAGDLFEDGLIRTLKQ